MSFFEKLIQKFILRSPLNKILGRKIYLNDAGLIANLIGDYFLKRNQKYFSLDKQKSSSKVDSFIRDGFLKLNSTVPVQDANLISQFLDLKFSEIGMPESFRLEIRSDEEKDFFNKLPFIKKIFNQEVVSVVQEYFKCGFQVYNAHIYRTYNTKRNPGSPYNSSPYGSTANWHHDGSSTDSLKLFLLVHNTKEIHGPMKFLNKTESMRALKKGFKFRNKNWNTILDNENKYRSLTGATGEMFLVDTNRCLHRAGEPQDQLTRDYLVIYLGSSKEEYDKKWYEIANRSDPWGFKRLSDAYNL